MPTSASSTSSASNAASCVRMPRNRSSVVESDTTLTASFLAIAPPSLGSDTTNVSAADADADPAAPLPLPCTSSTRNALSDLDSLPSAMAVMSSTAAAVDANRWIDCSLSRLLASAGVSNCLCSSASPSLPVSDMRNSA